VQDRYRGGGGGRPGGGGNRYGGGGGGGNRRRRGRGGNRQDIYPDVGANEPEEHLPWAEEYEREPNPDAEPLHLAYDSVYTHEGDVREELLENWVEASNSGKRWRCWNCGRTTQRFTQLRLPTLRTVVSICDNCGTWTVWDAWRDLANPRIFSLRRTIEESEPAREPGPGDSPRPQGGPSNGSGSPHPQAPAVAAPASPPSTPFTPPVSAPQGTAGQPGTAQTALPLGDTPVTPEPALQPPAPSGDGEGAAETKPKRAPRSRAKPAEEASITEAEAKPARAPRTRLKPPADEAPPAD